MNLSVTEEFLRAFEESRDEWAITIEDSFSGQENKVYYRLRITNSANIILSNPIFLERRNIGFDRKI